MQKGRKKEGNLPFPSQFYREKEFPLISAAPPPPPPPPPPQVVASGNVVDQRAEEKERLVVEAALAQRAQQDALVRVAEEQRARQEREEALRLQQERLAKLVGASPSVITSPLYNPFLWPFYHSLPFLYPSFTPHLPFLYPSFTPHLPLLYPSSTPLPPPPQAPWAKKEAAAPAAASHGPSLQEIQRVEAERVSGVAT